MTPKNRPRELLRGLNDMLDKYDPSDCIIHDKVIHTVRLIVDNFDLDIIELELSGLEYAASIKGLINDPYFQTN